MNDDNAGLVLAFAFFFYIGYLYADKKETEPTYGDTGLPKNCVAIVHEASEGVRRREYTPMEALHSIERNCGKYGYSLKE